MFYMAIMEETQPHKNGGPNQPSACFVQLGN